MTRTYLWYNENMNIFATMALTMNFISSSDGDERNGRESLNEQSEEKKNRKLTDTDVCTPLKKMFNKIYKRRKKKQNVLFGSLSLSSWSSTSSDGPAYIRNYSGMSERTTHTNCNIKQGFWIWFTDFFSSSLLLLNGKKNEWRSMRRTLYQTI